MGWHLSFRVKTRCYSLSHRCRHHALERSLNLQHCQLTAVMRHHNVQECHLECQLETREFTSWAARPSHVQPFLAASPTQGVQMQTCYFLPKGLCCKTAEKSFCSLTWISIPAQLLPPKLARYMSSSLPFMAGDGLSISYAPALLECSLKASCALSGAWECTLSQMTCPSRERNIYQFWQKRDRPLPVDLMIHPTPFQANEAQPLCFCCTKCEGLHAC